VSQKFCLLTRACWAAAARMVLVVARTRVVRCESVTGPRHVPARQLLRSGSSAGARLGAALP
jgi:hypothetical protein